MGIPCIGLDRKLFRRFRAQVEARGEDYISYWDRDDKTNRVREAVSAVIKRELHWPNARFLPGDQCCILFFDPSNCMDNARAILDIEKLYGKLAIFDRVNTVVFGDLISDIVRIII